MTNVVPIRRPVPKLRVPKLPECSGPLTLTLQEPLASLIRKEGVKFSKLPEKYVSDFMASSFRELDAG